MTSFVNGGPHKTHYATKPQGQWITKAKSSLIIDTRTFHHIVDTTFYFSLLKKEIRVRFHEEFSPFFIDNTKF